MIENLAKGQIPDPVDERDYQYGALVGASPIIDWEKGFRLPKPPDTDQGQADCCVAEAASKAHWQLKGKEFSVRSVFAYIAQSYGAFIRDGVKRIADFGQETIIEAPDPNPKTPANMRDLTGLKPELALDDKEFGYWSLNSLDMDYWAHAVENNRAVIFGVQGTNDGWKNGLVPEPPKAGDYDIPNKVWGHGLELAGYHMHTNSDGTKERCIIADSSWCNWVKEHHIRERYFKVKAVNSAWVLVPNKGAKPMYELVVKQDGKTFGVRVATPNGDQIIYATGEDQYRSWSKGDSYQLPTVNADGTTNWDAPVTRLPW